MASPCLTAVVLTTLVHCRGNTYRRAAGLSVGKNWPPDVQAPSGGREYGSFFRLNGQAVVLTLSAKNDRGDAHGTATSYFVSTCREFLLRCTIGGRQRRRHAQYHY